MKKLVKISLSTLSNICEDLFFNYLAEVSPSKPVQTKLNQDFPNLLSKILLSKNYLVKVQLKSLKITKSWFFLGLKMVFFFCEGCHPKLRTVLKNELFQSYFL